MSREAPLSPAYLFLAAYLGLESAIRLNIVWSQNRPIGSVAGFIVYAIYWALNPNRSTLPALVEPPRSAPALDVAADVAMRDAFILREPLLTLLTPSEQQRAADRFGYDYRRTAPAVAFIILFSCILGVVSSIVNLQNGGGLSPLLSLMTAGALGIEQIVRLTAFRRGPAASVLGFLVRPFARKVIV